MSEFCSTLATEAGKIDPVATNPVKIGSDLLDIVERLLKSVELPPKAEVLDAVDDVADALLDRVEWPRLIEYAVKQAVITGADWLYDKLASDD
jgi:hypothetical protein